MKNFILVCIAIILVSCSFDDKTGIWKDAATTPVERQEISPLNENIKSRFETVFQKEKIYNEEINNLNNIPLELDAPTSINNWVEKYGLEKEKYICFYSRTSEYRGDAQKSIRDSDIKTQIYGIEKLCREKNLKAVRLGYSPKTKLETNDVIIEYSNSSDRSDFLDFYLGKF